MVKQVHGETVVLAEEECPVCLEPNLSKTLVKGCQHSFCYACIAGWVKRGQPNCPICREQFQTLLKLRKPANRKGPKNGSTRRKPARPAAAYQAIAVTKLLPRPKQMCPVETRPMPFVYNPRSYMFGLLELVVLEPPRPLFASGDFSL